MTTNIEAFDNNILRNVLSTCGDCSLRSKCMKVASLKAEFDKEFEEKKIENMKKREQKSNDTNWEKQCMTELSSIQYNLSRKFDTSLEDRQCDYEKEEVIDSLQRLQDQFDFRDVRVYEIVKQHIKQLVIDFRAFKDLAKGDLIHYSHDDEGNTIHTLNPLADYKLRSGSYMVNLIRELDKIKKEDKIIDKIEEGNARLFTAYLSKISDDKSKEIIDIDLR